MGIAAASLAPSNGTDMQVPLIDISAWVGQGVASERRQVARSVDDALRGSGFMQVVGHAIPDVVIADMVSAADGFFALAPEAKTRYCVTGANRGYTPPRSEALSVSIGVEPEPGSKDYFEAFNVGVEGSSFAGLDLPEPEYAANAWPSEPERFRAAVERYFAEAGRVARTLTTIFESALGEAQGFFDTLTDHSIDVLRLNNYALPDEAELGSATAMGAHTDFGIVTVLWADQVPGLQLLDADGVWHDVMPADGALLVNIGDLTARLTNDVWMSTMHRVLPPRVDGRLVRRRSAAYFHDGNYDAVIATRPRFENADGRAGYVPLTVREHLRVKLAGSRQGRPNTAAERDAARLRPARTAARDQVR